MLVLLKSLVQEPEAYSGSTDIGFSTTQRPQTATLLHVTYGTHGFVPFFLYWSPTWNSSPSCQRRPGLGHSREPRACTWQKDLPQMAPPAHVSHPSPKIQHEMVIWGVLWGAADLLLQYSTNAREIFCAHHRPIAHRALKVCSCKVSSVVPYGYISLTCWKILMAEGPSAEMASGLLVTLCGGDSKLPLWAHPDGCDFIRGSRLVNQTFNAPNVALSSMEVACLQTLWREVDPLSVGPPIWQVGYYDIPVLSLPCARNALPTRVLDPPYAWVIGAIWNSGETSRLWNILSSGKTIIGNVAGKNTRGARAPCSKAGYWGGPQNGSPKPDRFASSKVGVCPCCFPVSAAAAREDEFAILHFVSLA